MKRIMFISARDRLYSEMLSYLEGRGYVMIEQSGREGLVAEIEEQQPDLVLAEGPRSQELCRRVRRNAAIGNTPVVVFSSNPSEAELVACIEAGADHYVSMPIGFTELAARVKAVMRRFDRTSSASTIEAGSILLDRAAMVLRVRGVEVAITPTEFRLLDCLMQHSGNVVTRDQIQDAVWGVNYFVSSPAINVLIRRLRQKIEIDAASPRCFRTVRRVGYCFSIPVTSHVHLSLGVEAVDTLGRPSGRIERGKNWKQGIAVQSRRKPSCTSNFLPPSPTSRELIGSQR